jgi:predicted double-glycine peptidase
VITVNKNAATRLLMSTCLAALALGADAADVAAAGKAGALDVPGVPFYRQQKDGCGASSVAMVMQYWGQRLSRTYPTSAEAHAALLRPKLHHETVGILLADMSRYMQQVGFRAFTLRGQWSDLKEHLAKGRPVVVRLAQDGHAHFAVVTGLDGENVRLNDPARKKASRKDRQEFEKQWSLAGRWMLLATP